eukprot:jgi/Tetstr1/454485/TSEL_041385.t1
MPTPRAHRAAAREQRTPDAPAGGGTSAPADIASGVPDLDSRLRLNPGGRMRTFTAADPAERESAGGNFWVGAEWAGHAHCGERGQEHRAGSVLRLAEKDAAELEADLALGGVSSPHSLYLIGASSIHQALATPTLEPDAGANASAPMWAVELRAAHTLVVDKCGDAMLEDLAGPLASALKLLPSKRSHVARAGCSAAGAEPASVMRSAADLQAIPHYSDFPLHSMRKVQGT